jgi:plasmid stabilization system protein ParE
LKKLRYTPAARDQLTRILNEISSVSPSGSRNVARRIRAVISVLRTYPEMGTQTEDRLIRRVNARPYPYLIFYQQRGDIVLIHAIAHSARNPDDMPGTP